MKIYNIQTINIIVSQFSLPGYAQFTTTIIQDLWQGIWVSILDFEYTEPRTPLMNNNLFSV